MYIRDDKTDTFFGFYRALVVNDGLPDDNDSNKKVDEENRFRVQVRVVGVHSFNNDKDFSDGIPDGDLPFAEQAAPFVFGGFPTSGIGINSVPQKGSWVWVFFDNGDPNRPVYFASILGNNDVNSQSGRDTTIIKTKSGHTISISDKEEQEKISISHSNGAKVVLNTFDNKSTIQHIADVVKIDAKEIDFLTADGNGSYGHPILTISDSDTLSIGSSTLYVAKKIRMK